jgi:hypothetical protein
MENRENDERQIDTAPVGQPVAMSGVDETFARQVTEFIEEFRRALEALAKG